MGESSMIPVEIVDQLRRFHESINVMEDAFGPFLTQKPDDRLKFSPLEQARCNLLSAFAINSFYWIFLRLRGLNPKENESLSNELKRTKDYMTRLKLIEDRALAPKLNKRAATSFVRNALWEPKEKLGSCQNEETNNAGVQQMDNDDSFQIDEEHLSSEPVCSKRPSSTPIPSDSVAAKKKKSDSFFASN